MQEIAYENLIEAIGLGENVEWEFKSARGGVPGSMWESYSAMANTEGGLIVLGVEQKENRFYVSGLQDNSKTRKEIWDALNNRGKVSINLLSESDVEVKYIDEKPVIILKIPRAGRRQRPVYIGQNPLTGTFRRNHEGDYKCTADEVGRMLADQAEEPADSLILEHFHMGDLDEESIRQYRNRFSARSPGHPWLKEDVKGFLGKLGGWRKERASSVEGITVAGLLMFGKDDAIRSPEAIPGFNLDYREIPQDATKIRWFDRLTQDGTWAGNIFQFYERVIIKLTADLKIPFKLSQELFRVDDTIVHEAIREALVNALIHADYRGMGGVVIEKRSDSFVMSNPGSLLVSRRQLSSGGISECRNKSLQLMFQMIGSGEKAGSGIDKIRQGWKSQHWRSPSIKEQVQPDRIHLMMPMVSMLPAETLERLNHAFGNRFSSLDSNEVQTLVTTDVEGQVSNSRMQEMVDSHPADITKTLQGLVRKGYLKPEGFGRGTRYVFVNPSKKNSLQLDGDSLHLGGGSLHSVWDSSMRLEQMEPEQLKRLQELAAPVFKNKKCRQENIHSVILKICENSHLTAEHIGELLNRNAQALQYRFIRSMVAAGLLELKYPDKPNRPDQAYRAKKRNTVDE